MNPRNSSIAITQAYQSAKGARAFIRRKARRSTPVTCRYTDPPGPFYGSPIDNWVILCAWQHRVKLRFSDRQSDIKKC